LKKSQYLTVLLLCICVSQILAPTQCLVAPVAQNGSSTIPMVGEFYIDGLDDYFFFYRIPAFETGVKVFMFHSIFESDVELIGNPDFFPNQIFDPALCWNQSLGIINYSYVDSPSELYEKCVDYWEIDVNTESVLKIGVKGFTGWLYYKAFIVDSSTNQIVGQSSIQKMISTYLNTGSATTLGNQFKPNVPKKQIDMGESLNVTFEFTLAPFERIFKIQLRDGSNVISEVFLNVDEGFTTENITVTFPLAREERAFNEANIYVYTYKIDVSGLAQQPAITIYQSQEFSFKIYNDRPYLVILGVGAIAIFVGILVWIRRTSTKNYTEALRKILNSTNIIRKEEVP